MIIVIQTSRGKRLHHVLLWKQMKEWQFCLILLEVYYQIEVPFPVAHLKNEKKTGLHCQLWHLIQEVIDFKMLSSEWECTTKLKFHYLFFPFSIVKQGMEFQLGSALPLVHSISSWILYYNYQCKTCSFDNSISYVEQDMEFLAV